MDEQMKAIITEVGDAIGQPAENKAAKNFLKTIFLKSIILFRQGDCFIL
jgi:hypothetical protein